MSICGKSIEDLTPEVVYKVQKREKARKWVERDFRPDETYCCCREHLRLYKTRRRENIYG